MTLITRQRVLGAKAEGTPGTAETLNAATGVMNCYDHQFTPDVPMSERPSQGTYDAPLVSIPTTRAAGISFRTDLAGESSGTEYWIDNLLAACGFSVSSQTATANGSACTTTATVGIFQDGILKQIAGAQGSVSIPFVVGEPLYGNFDMRGKLSTPSDATLLTPTYSTKKPQRVAGATVTLASSALPFKTGSINIQNTMAMVPKASDDTGYDHTQITLQRITVSLDPEADLVANRDDWGDLFAGNTGTFSMQVGDADDRLTFTIPGLQKTGVEDGDRDGVLTHNLTLLHTGTSPMTIVSA
jgi:hypothetical protein